MHDQCPAEHPKRSDKQTHLQEQDFHSFRASVLWIPTAVGGPQKAEDGDQGSDESL